MYESLDVSDLRIYCDVCIYIRITDIHKYILASIHAALRTNVSYPAMSSAPDLSSLFVLVLQQQEQHLRRELAASMLEMLAPTHLAYVLAAF